MDRLYPLRRGHLNQDVREMRKSAMQKRLWAEGTKPQAAQCLEFLKSHKEASGGGTEESEGVTGEGTETAGVALGLGPGTCRTLVPTWNKMVGLGRVSSREVL